MSFSDIITKVKGRPELWQSSHPFYRHRVVTAKTWKEIAAELRADDWDLIRKRWKHLKDTFRKEMKKLTSNQIAKSVWVHYSDLEFLSNEILRNRRREESDVSETETEPKKKRKPRRLRRRKRFEPVTPVDAKTQSLMKFKKIMRSLNSLSKCVERSTSSMDEEFKNDTDYMFLVSLLPTMRNLSDIQRLHFRGKINNWLLNALMENEFSGDCDNKAYVQKQIKEANIDCKVEMEDNK